MTKEIREFEGGATRNSEEGKLDYEGFLSPLVLRRYAEYLDSHRALEDGTMRDSDNWQRGMPLDVYMKSMWRHFMDLWTMHRTPGTILRHTLGYNIEVALCAILFNASGYLHELLKQPVVGEGSSVTRTTEPNTLNELSELNQDSAKRR